MTQVPRLSTADKTQDHVIHDLLARVGHRVRARRQSLGLPRRAVSEASGVSPRYIAQIEAGEGNISIALLQRVAMALQCKIDDLLQDGEPGGLTALFQAANPDVQEAVLQLLTSPSEPPQRAGRLCLIGLRGAGKSTLGARVGDAFDVPFVALNTEIEAQSGMPVGAVMALYGQEGHRVPEAHALERVVATHDSDALPVAGGIVTVTATQTPFLECTT